MYVRVDVEAFTNSGGRVYLSANEVLQSMATVPVDCLSFWELDGFPLRDDGPRLLLDNFDWRKNVFFKDSKTHNIILGDSMCRNIGPYSYIEQCREVVSVSKGSNCFISVDPYCINSTLPGAIVDRVRMALPQLQYLEGPSEVRVDNNFIIFAGTNDSHSISFNENRFYSSYKCLINKIRTYSLSSKIICISLVPRFSVSSRYVNSSPPVHAINSNVLAINRIIQRLTGENRNSVLYLDMHDIFRRYLDLDIGFLCSRNCFEYLRSKRVLWKRLFRPDGLHPSCEGVRLINQEIIRFIQHMGV